MLPVLLLPGLGGSGPGHWQSHWQRADPAMTRLSVPDWDRPELADWCAALDRAVNAHARPPILVAHSLACLLVAHWAQARGPRAAGAILVAVPDPSGPQFPVEARSFAQVPEQPLPFPSVVVASADDPYGSLDHSERRARQWGSRLIAVGSLGHINADSNLGEWARGREILAVFRTELEGNRA
ncbi:serine hydrolase family protein [Aurantiacibacter xanthus]|uniref:Serine hydrolase family protein n=1 Tax=Aurantiacibacter xanthus TaxID=1784712 RepID=A0A3A1P1Q9_9SPHN|nr:alpha/beta hydrolase [Aurantiacibacter xanthus]RIV80984.1 serine hydrolase family protein [Aurantiacibacter xanthus]